MISVLLIPYLIFMMCFEIAEVAHTLDNWDLFIGVVGQPGSRNLERCKQRVREAGMELAKKNVHINDWPRKMTGSMFDAIIVKTMIRI